MKKSSIGDGFRYDLMTILDSGLLFGATPYIKRIKSRRVQNACTMRFDLLCACATSLRDEVGLIGFGPERLTFTGSDNLLALPATRH